MTQKSDPPKKADDPIETPTPCGHCNGTGQATPAATPPNSGAPPTSYSDGTCPVCGGSGKQPAPTIHADKKNSNCFVATAAFQDADAHEVRTLRAFRDAHLLPHVPGRLFVRIYYAVGPRLGKSLHGRPRLRQAVRYALRKLSNRLRQSSSKR